jgi:hypothetical protein
VSKPGDWPAIGTLIFGMNSSQAAIDAEDIFEDFEEAFKYVRILVEKKNERFRGAQGMRDNPV